MQDVRCDGYEGVGEGKRLPEWMEYGFLIRLTTGGVKCMCIAIGEVVYVPDFVVVAQGESSKTSKLIRWYETFRASTVVHAHYQNLFWIVSNKQGKYGMALSPDAIPAHHCDASFANSCDRT